MEFAPDPRRVGEKLSRSDRPYVVLKAAVSLDGKIATAQGESRWITGEAAREAGHRLRAACGGVMVGIGTALSDDPHLTVRLPGQPADAPQPARVVLDSGARIGPGARCLAADGARRVVVAGSGADGARVAALEAAGVEVVRCPSARPAPAEFLPLLRRGGLETLLVEGGGQVHAGLIADGEADELFLFVAGLVMGDGGAPGWCAPLGLERLDQLPRLELAAPESVGGDVVLHGFF